MAQLAISLLRNIICRLAAARAICLRGQAAVFEELEKKKKSPSSPATVATRLVVQRVQVARKINVALFHFCDGRFRQLIFAWELDQCSFATLYVSGTQPEFLCDVPGEIFLKEECLVHKI